MKDSKTHLEHLALAYASMFLAGLKHLSVTRENITLSGKLLDYEDVESLVTQETFEVLIFLRIPISARERTVRITDLRTKSAQKYLRRARLFTSSLHQLLSAQEISLEGFSFLDPKVKFTEARARRQFSRALTEVFKKAYAADADWLELMQEFLAFEYGAKHGPRATYQGAKFYAFLRRLLAFDVELREAKYEDDAIGLQLAVKFNRPRQKLAIAERFNRRNLNLRLDDVVAKLLAQLRVATLTGGVDDEAWEHLSSACNDVLLRSSMIFPYQIQRGTLSLRRPMPAEILTEVRKMLSGVGLRLHRLWVFRDEDDESLTSMTAREFSDLEEAVILSGLTVVLPDGVKHQLPFRPTLVSV